MTYSKIGGSYFFEESKIRGSISLSLFFFFKEGSIYLDFSINVFRDCIKQFKDYVVILKIQPY